MSAQSAHSHFSHSLFTEQLNNIMETENINIKDIKVGETYNVRVKVKTKGEDYIRVTPILQGGVLSPYWPTSFALGESSAFFPIPPENENSEPAPKYDPCRRFRKGDKVEYRPKDGRELFEAKRLLAQTLTVVENEHEEYNRVSVEAQNGDVHSVPFYYLELVTPVEELVRYVVEPSDVAYFIVDKKHERGEQNVVMYMFAFHPHAKEAAEAECARLNAEYRKENA